MESFARFLLTAPVIALLTALPARSDRLDNYRDWGIYRGDKKGNQFSELAQINTSNVRQLELAWEYRHGNPVGPGMYSNPITINGLLYFTTQEVNAVALNAATGEEVWVFDHSIYNEGKKFRGRNRGVVYWEDARGKNGRIFNFVRDRIYGIDARTGELIEDFGENGFIDLRKHLPVPPETADIEVTTPGITYGNLLIVGSRVQEGNVGTPGDVRAFDARTGEFRWIFNTVPLDGQFGYDTWEREEGMIYGGANPWGGLTLDEERGWVFFAAGAASGEFIYGGSRKGRNLFANCVLALDASTGERKWHYQTIRHDIWDYDNPPAPILATITQEGKPRDVVVQLTKMGLTFVLDRVTGEPVFPVIDLPVPPSDVPGEEAWPSQPFPLKPPPLVRLSVHESDLTTITPESHAVALERFRKHRAGSLYTPASIEGTITMPGHQGGAEWGGGAFDPATGVLYVNTNEYPSINILRPLEPDNPLAPATAFERGERLYQTNCTICHGYTRQGNPPLYPALTELQLSPEKIREALNQGRGSMPAFPRFSESDLDDLVAYLRGDTPDVPADRNNAPDAGGPPTWSGGSGSTRWTTTTPQYANDAPFFIDHMGYPAIKPPWGTLNAINLNKGEILWKVPLGEYPKLVEMGIRHTGTRNFGGPALTAGNLIFIAATEDEKIRAFDKFTGSVLWEYQLPAGGYATPSIYMIGGKQYVVIAAGGGGKPNTKPGDSILAFALPNPEAE